MARKLFIGAFLICLFLSFAYSQRGGVRPQTVFRSQTKDTCAQITLATLQNATYEDVNFGKVTMRNGRYANNEEAGFIADLRYAAWGDLNSDGCKDVILILFSYQGGNDPDETICAVLNNGGKIGQIICRPLDGYATDSIAIVGGVVSIKMAIYQENDSHSSPSKSDVWKFVVDGTEIKRLR
jgi:hypothetical protein